MEIVPFGKYRGQAIENMLSDQEYCDWITLQPWFRERFGNVYNIINNVSREEPSETPEHNAFQAEFLSETVCNNVVRLLTGGKFAKLDCRSFEDVFDVSLLFSASSLCLPPIGIELKPVIGDDYPAVIRQVKRQSETASRKRDGFWHMFTVNFPIVCFKEFKSSAVSYEQVFEIFRESGIFFLKFDRINKEIPLLNLPGVTA